MNSSLTDTIIVEDRIVFKPFKSAKCFNIHQTSQKYSLRWMSSIKIYHRKIVDEQESG